jgi:hypothetical protein
MKKWYYSKTIWANMLVVVAMIIQVYTGKDWINADIQVAILALINLILRIVTKENLSW